MHHGLSQGDPGHTTVSFCWTADVTLWCTTLMSLLLFPASF